ncbi:MAG TPA: (5-formylfuran-3-yl)methyl phosphate synthase [Candidatus Limnocylindrales bacterium]|nr:(5-formylfuran-3-yl)methyl phosphate synthase [Candidatus Limnocylindrales bacterium]
MQLLVSVTDVEEAENAMEGGADIIDIKNPSEGSLGANFPHVIREIVSKIPSSLESSATLGDVPNLPGTVSLAGAGAAWCGVNYVKVGLMGVRTLEDAIFLLKQLRHAVKMINPHIKVIAAGYADAAMVKALNPLLLPLVSSQAGIEGCMIDTAIKDGHNLFYYLNRDQLENFVTEAQGSGLICALAGSLREVDIPLIQELGADIIGLRTAVCEGDRVRGRVSKSKVQRIRSILEMKSLNGHLQTTYP